MQYQALYRKYRPDKFEEIVGQNHIVKILKNSIITNKIGHAYLFSGPRGTGKTSAAKILANTLNCLNISDGEKCFFCQNCIDNSNIDIIEIDAASNNGVDEIREIRNNSKLLPVKSKYKVYIVDEVHMLSIGAFNALLKTLEEPPKHVIFILATTELQKVPLTIISRCQKFQFKKISTVEITERLEYIVKQEKLKITDEALKLISELSDGGLRDAINMLDQVCSITEGIVEEESVAEICGIILNSEIENFLSYLQNNDTFNLFGFLEKINNEGKNYVTFCERLIIYLRNLLINSAVRDNIVKPQLIKYVYAFIELENSLKKSLNQKILFEIKVLELLNLNFDIVENSNKNIKKDSEKVKVNKILEDSKEETIKENEQNNALSINEIRINNSLATANKQILFELKDRENKFNEYLSNNKYGNLAIMLSNSELVVASEEYLVFTVEDYTSKNYLINNLKLTEEFINEIFEKKIKPSFLTNKEWLDTIEDFKTNLKKGIKYKLIDEPEFKIIKNSKMTKIEETAYDLFGEESIKIN